MRGAQGEGDNRGGRHRVEGIVTLVQEDRFTLFCEDGSYRLFLLAHDCPADVAELEAAVRERARIVVECEAAEDLIAARARRLYRADRTQGRRA